MAEKSKHRDNGAALFENEIPINPYGRLAVLDAIHRESTTQWVRLAA